jgi:hypothetical protein
MLKLSDAVICHCMNHTGDDRGNPCGAKVISISVAGAQFYAQLDLCYDPSYIHNDSTLKMVDKVLSMKHIL